LHYMVNYAEFEDEWYDAYEAVNRRFADVIDEVAGEDDLVWVHDYHLMLVPGLLRRRRGGYRIGFFLHTPFPSYEVFRCHPRRDALIEGLLGADLIGFHTFGYLRHFRSAVLRLLGLHSQPDRIFRETHTTYIGTHPIGINARAFDEALDSEAVRTQMEELQEHYADKRIVLSVERLDYTKGIPEKLLAIEKLLAEDPPRREDTVFILIAIPSREDVRAYQDLQDEVNLEVTRINGQFATIENMPVHFIHHGVRFEELTALYAMADVAMVTPLIDGMNLVAKEYVACQREGRGMLILSEFAGAAQELFNAVLVNPYDVNGMTDAIRKALMLDAGTKKALTEPMRRRVIEHDAVYWARHFIEELEATGGEPRHEEIRPIPPWVAQAVGDRGRRKAFFLDYDGTLRDFVDKPAEAVPTPRLRTLLASLSERRDIDIFILSGRDRDFLDNHLGGWGFTLVAEHGYSLRRPGGAWELAAPKAANGWKDEILPILEMYADSTPGCHVEVKQSSLVWHYRQADPEFGLWKATELIGHLDEVAANLPVRVTHGHKIVEVSSQQTTKGAALERLTGEIAYDLILAVGDDQTDETMFLVVDDRLVSIKIGSGPTAAHYRLASPGAFMTLLQGWLGIAEIDAITQA
ncbi:MAG: bifunctional alpha,alpha-trehalose-phosphate synthase (UDP-forming)/trehalose-phosphatase, partial [Planctomycetota bacterium]